MNYQEVYRPNLSDQDQKLLWYPLAEIVSPRMKTQGIYSTNYPVGAVVHFTAGRSKTDQDALNSLAYGREQNFSYFTISRSGKVYQASPLNQWGYHCGESKHPILGNGLSRKLVGIELACAGKLDKIGDNKYKSWFGEVFESADVRECTGENWGEVGYYHKYSFEQEYALTNLILWLKVNNPSVFNLDYVLGHHEISGKQALGHWRKNDPGASLSMPMKYYRDKLKEGFLWNNVVKNGTTGEEIK